MLYYNSPNTTSLLNAAFSFQDALLMSQHQPKGPYASPAACDPQRYTVEIIQLEEVSAPPSRPGPSPPTSASSSYYTSSVDSDGEGQPEDEYCGESYCSSDLSSPELEQDKEAQEMEPTMVDDTYRTRMRRIQMWREHYLKESGMSCPELVLPSSNSQRDASGEKILNGDYEGVNSSQSNATDDSDSHAANGHLLHRSAPKRAPSFSVHSCPACDASFDTRQNLRRHGRGPRTNEACRVAVEYDCE